MARHDKDIYALKQRVKRLERQVAFLLDHLRLDYPEAMDPGLTSEVMTLVREGRKIDAIRLYREITGVGLKEAKEVIDSL
jgi:ribosomal protein L7/L12